MNSLELTPTSELSEELFDALLLEDRTWTLHERDTGCVAHALCGRLGKSRSWLPGRFLSGDRPIAQPLNGDCIT